MQYLQNDTYPYGYHARRRAIIEASYCSYPLRQLLPQELKEFLASPDYGSDKIVLMCDLGDPRMWKVMRRLKRGGTDGDIYDAPVVLSRAQHLRFARIYGVPTCPTYLLFREGKLAAMRSAFSGGSLKEWAARDPQGLFPGIGPKGTKADGPWGMMAVGATGSGKSSPVNAFDPTMDSWRRRIETQYRAALVRKLKRRTVRRFSPPPSEAEAANRRFEKKQNDEAVMRRIS